MMLFPFVYLWYVKRLVGHPKTVLDLGCGNGEFMQGICEANWEITGIDIYQESLDLSKEKGIYKKLIKGEIIKVCEKLIREKRKFDLIVCSQTIEHIYKTQGYKLLKLSDKLATERIYVSTPRGHVKQEKKYLELNPFHVHKSGWYEKDFGKLGYKVYGIGLNYVWSEEGIARRYNNYIAKIAMLISYLLSPIIYYFPTLAAGLVVIKKK